MPPPAGGVAVKLRSPLGSVAKPSDPVTVPVLGSAALTVGVPAFGAGSNDFSIWLANENKTNCTGLAGLGIGFAGFIPPTVSNTLATTFARPSSGETCTRDPPRG